MKPLRYFRAFLTKTATQPKIDMRKSVLLETTSLIERQMMKKSNVLLLLIVCGFLSALSNSAEAQLFRRGMRSCGGCNAVPVRLFRCSPRVAASCQASPCQATPMPTAFASNMPSCGCSGVSFATGDLQFGTPIDPRNGDQGNNGVIDLGGTTQETCQLTYVACLASCRKECPENLTACQAHCECNRKKCDPTIQTNCNAPRPTCLTTAQPNPTPTGNPTGN